MVGPDRRQVDGRYSWDLKLINFSIDNVDIQHLTNLRIISTGAQEPHYQLTLQPLILRIIVSNLKTIEVIELFDMEITCRREGIERVCECWTELDGLLEDKVFSSLKEIRLLFQSSQSSDDLARNNPPLMYEFFTAEEVVSIFESCLLKSSARGIRITYHLTYGRHDLLERYWMWHLFVYLHRCGKGVPIGWVSQMGKEVKKK